MKDLNRRSFIKNSALLAGGSAIIANPLMSSAFYAGADEIKVALIGCGGRGTGAAFQALSVKENVRLVAMADAFKDRIDKSHTSLTTGKALKGQVASRVMVSEENKFVGFDGYKKAMALADVVILTTPPGFRPIHFEEAVRQTSTSLWKNLWLQMPQELEGFWRQQKRQRRKT